MTGEARALLRGARSFNALCRKETLQDIASNHGDRVLIVILGKRTTPGDGSSREHSTAIRTFEIHHVSSDEWIARTVKSRVQFENVLNESEPLGAEVRRRC